MKRATLGSDTAGASLGRSFIVLSNGPAPRRFHWAAREPGEGRFGTPARGRFGVSNPSPVRPLLSGDPAPAGPVHRENEMQNDFDTTKVPSGSGAGSEPRNSERHGEAAREGASQVGIDTQELGRAVGDRAGEWQQMLLDEIQARPLRTLGWAAAAGFVFGVWSAR
jgi:hypothetical protein